MKKHKIILFHANPKDTIKGPYKPLRLDELTKRIEECFKNGNYGNQFIVNPKWAVTIADFRETLLNEQHPPVIVQFSGHGDRAQFLLFENQEGNSQKVKATAIGDFFGLLQPEKRPRCVFLAACYSEDIAEAIAKHVDFVIGMNAPIEDQTAIVFSEGFYYAIASGYPVQQAFELGKNALALDNLPDKHKPVIFPAHELPEAEKGWFVPSALQQAPVAPTHKAALMTDLFDIQLPQNTRYASISCNRIDELKAVKRHFLEQKNHSFSHYFLADRGADKADSLIERFISELVDEGKEIDYRISPNARYQYLQIEPLPFDGFSPERSQQAMRQYFIDRYAHESQQVLNIKTMEDFLSSNMPSLRKDCLVVALKIDTEHQNEFLSTHLDWIVKTFSRGTHNQLRVLFFYLVSMPQQKKWWQKLRPKNDHGLEMLKKINDLAKHQDNCCFIDQFSRVDSSHIKSWFEKYSKDTIQIERIITEAQADVDYKKFYDTKSQSFRMAAVEDLLKRLIERERKKRPAFEE